MEIGGEVNFSFDKDKNGDATVVDKQTYKIMPSLMYYVTDNIAIGGKIGFDYTKDKMADTKTTLFRIQPTVRYKKVLGAGFSWAPEFYVGLGFGSFKEDDCDSENSTNVQVGLSWARFEYAVSDNWVVSMKFGDLYYDYNKAGEYKSNEFKLDLIENTSLGIAYKF